AVVAAVAEGNRAHRGRTEVGPALPLPSVAAAAEHLPRPAPGKEDGVGGHPLADHAASHIFLFLVRQGREALWMLLDALLDGIRGARSQAKGQGEEKEAHEWGRALLPRYRGIPSPRKYSPLARG